MFDRDKWQEIYHTLSRNKLRTFLTAFGVFWGIFMLLIMLGAGKGLQNGAEKNFDGWATNSFFIWTRQTTKEYKGFLPGRRCELTNDDAAALKSKIPEIEVLAPRHRMGGGNVSSEVSHGAKAASLSILGDYPEYSAIERFNLGQGRFINDRDIIERRKVIVLGKRAVELLFDKDKNPLGELVQIGGISFKVVGILKPPPRNGDWQAESVFIPFTTFQYAFNYGNKVGWMGLTVKKGFSVAQVEEKALVLLKQRHKVHPEDKQAFGSENLEKYVQQMDGLFKWIKIVSWVVGGMTLLAGVIGISNIMLIIIKERTKEIGVRRAIGASPVEIIKQIIMESVALTTLAGYFGLLAGIGLLEFISQTMKKSGEESGPFNNPGVDLGIALTALAILIISGVLAGLIPAYRALKIKPVEALRAD